MDDNLVSMEIALDATLFVGVESSLKNKGAESVGQSISSFLPKWVDTILANRSSGVVAHGKKRSVA